VNNNVPSDGTGLRCLADRLSERARSTAETSSDGFVATASQPRSARAVERSDHRADSALPRGRPSNEARPTAAPVITEPPIAESTTDAAGGQAERASSLHSSASYARARSAVGDEESERRKRARDQTLRGQSRSRSFGCMCANSNVACVRRREQRWSAADASWCSSPCAASVRRRGTDGGPCGEHTLVSRTRPSAESAVFARIESEARGGTLKASSRSPAAVRWCRPGRPAASRRSSEKKAL
jgi:hypothetical protein